MHHLPYCTMSVLLSVLKTLNLSCIGPCFVALNTLHLHGTINKKINIYDRMIDLIGPEMLFAPRLLHQLEKAIGRAITPIDYSYLQEVKRYYLRTIVLKSEIDISALNCAINELNSCLSTQQLQLVTIHNLPNTSDTQLEELNTKVNNVMCIYRTLGIENASNLWFYNWSSFDMASYNNIMLTF